MPLLAAIAAKTSRIEVGTGVIDMRYAILGLEHLLQKSWTQHRWATKPVKRYDWR